MSVPQGSTPYNHLVVDKYTASITLATSCDQLAGLVTQAVGILNQTLASATQQYNAIVATLNQTETDAINLYNQIASIAGWQAAQQASNAQLATAAALSPLNVAGIVSYLQLQASATIAVNNTSLLTIIQQLLALNSAYQTLNNDITRLTRQVSTLETQLTEIPLSISSIINAAEDAAARFENCVIPSFV